MDYANPVVHVSCGVMEVAEKVKKLMTERGLNQSDLAEMAGVSRQKISLVLSEAASLKSYQLLRLARGLGVDLEYLVDAAMLDPKPSSHLTDDELAILQVYRALQPQLDPAKAIRALSAASNAEISRRATQTSPRHGDLLPPPEGRLSKDTVAIQNLDESDARRRYEKTHAAREASRKKEPEGESPKGGTKRGPRKGGTNEAG